MAAAVAAAVALQRLMSAVGCGLWVATAVVATAEAVPATTTGHYDGG